MEVILLKRIVKLGQIGDVVKVKDGYGRNFLIPNNAAMRATEENKKVFEAKKAQLELENINLKKEAESVFSKVNNHSIVIVRSAGESGHLYGSVKATDVAKSLSEDGLKVDKSQVIIKTPVKTLGVYNISLMLHSEVEAEIIVNVARSVEDAKNQMNNYLKENRSSETQEVEPTVQTA